ncbi:hypothetical protein [Bacillus sp. FSL K6-3431]|uniref:hypothetical protein n=1 Tax=Bacillus sp. FSL K6-3431 TaxID=2921500 RepID=UPI0030F8D9DD
MMQINQMTPKYENGEMTGLTIYFTGKIGSINFNGPITLTAEEFKPFLQPEKMETAVKNKVIDEIMDGNVESPTE